MKTSIREETLRIDVLPDVSVKGAVGIPEWWPSGQRVGIIFAHDTGTSMEDEIIKLVHGSLAQRGYLTLRFNFPYVEQNRKRPDPFPLLARTYRAAATSLLGDPENAPVRIAFAGFGLGARVASGVVAQGLKADALVHLGYPLHPSGKPNLARADELRRITCPILFIQGSRDAHCRVDKLESVLRRVGAPTTLRVVEDVDRRMQLVKRTPRSREEVEAEILGTIDAFLRRTMGGF